MISSFVTSAMCNGYWFKTVTLLTCRGQWQTTAVFCQKQSWICLMSNGEGLRRTKTKRALLMIIRKRQLGFLEHIMGKNGLEELILTESVDGKRSRGSIEREVPYKPKQMGGRTALKERER